jgi:predicted SprT family Zn-dependent metalloprotease
LKQRPWPSQQGRLTLIPESVGLKEDEAKYRCSCGQEVSRTWAGISNAARFKRDSACRKCQKKARKAPRTTTRNEWRIE